MKSTNLSSLMAVIGILAAVVMVSGQEAAVPTSADLEPEFNKLGLAAQIQGRRDTCSLFAITSAAGFEYGRQHPRPDNRLSEEYLVWAANQATGLKGDQAMFYEAVHGLNTLGICQKSLMPYADKGDSNRTPSHEALADAKTRSEQWNPQWIKRWDTKNPLTDDQMSAIKKALTHGHPVACGMRWPKNLKDASLLKVPKNDDVFDGHSILVVGYEDDPNEAGKGQFRLRNSDGPQWGKNGYGVMSYAYARTYMNDALWLRLESSEAEVPTERFEAELMPVRAKKKCPTQAQKMDQWGGPMWSHEQQLFCSAEVRGHVELGFQVRTAGRFRIRVLATAAPDFGVVRMGIDGQAAGPEFDLYSGRVCPAGSLELGDHQMIAGRHVLRVTAIRKNAASGNTFFGLDALDLIVVP